jgi:hypothetical protein
MTTPDPTPRPRKRRRRSTRAERPAEADKPIAPSVWLVLGGLLLVMAACVFFAADSISTYNRPDGFWVWFFLDLGINLLGKNPTAIILGGLALLSLGWGGWRWLQDRSARPAAPEDSPPE